MLALSTEDSFFFDISTNTDPMVDFCVWVLESDGLKVAPFDQHPDGDGSLRAVGLTAHDWQSWLRRICLSTDRRLGWHTPDIQAEIEQQVARDEAAIAQVRPQILAVHPELDPASINLGRVAQKRTAFSEWRERQYTIAAALIPQLLGTSELPQPSFNPVDYWQGNPDVKARLEDLWADFRVRIFPRRKRVCDGDVRDLMREHGDALSAHLKARNRAWRPYLSDLPVVKFDIVNYPAPIEYVIPPITAILTDKIYCRRDDSSLQATVRLIERLIDAYSAIIHVNKHVGDGAS
ncbi:MAG: hypothetical protein AAGF66_11825 [Cyanobacteria bacterium P01_H01_bin.119]